MYLEGNFLTKIPRAVTNLPELRILSFAQTPPTELPPVSLTSKNLLSKRRLHSNIWAHEQYHDRLKQTIGCTLSIGGSKNIGKAIDLYYKNPRFSSPLFIKFPSGVRLDLNVCARKTALQEVARYGTVGETQPATIGWSDAVSQDVNDQLVDFNLEVVGRIPGAKIINIDTGEIFQNSIKERHSSERRHVQMDLFDVTDENTRIMVKEKVCANRSYELELYISSKFRGTLIFEPPVPDEELPLGDNNLSVHFVPLVLDESGNFPSSQHKILRLPEIGDSEFCTFNFVVPTLIETYRVRLIISYHNRVLQTMILSAPVGDSVGKFLLEPENVVDPYFDRLSERKSFDVAIIVNDSPSGVPGLITLKGELANFYELPKLDVYANWMREQIYNKSACPRVSKSYESDGLRELIYILSVLGKNLWDELPQTIRELVTAETKRIQIVDVTSGVYFPAEFIYCGRSPVKGAKFCPNSAKVLQSPFNQNSCFEGPHDKCEYWDDPDYLCPLRMWGFRYVIERQPANDAQQTRNFLSDKTSNEQNAGKDIFDHVVIAVSKVVYNANPMAANELKSKLIKVAKNVDIAKDWTELKTIVNKKSPSLLVLIPDSGIDEEFYKQTKKPKSEGIKISTLELGGEIIRRDCFERENIQGSNGGRPVVLLLGCNTNTAEFPFLNFIKRFEDCGAAMVMGTITPVEANRTVDFVKGFIDAYVTAKESSPTFGELLLEMRRQMLAAGDGYALSLLAYGDTDQLTR